jgi:hypothetical protein
VDESTTLALSAHFGGSASEANSDPKSFKDAMLMPNADAWHLAMMEELAAMDSNQTWPRLFLDVKKGGIRVKMRSWDVGLVDLFELVPHGLGIVF